MYIAITFKLLDIHKSKHIYKVHTLSLDFMEISSEVIWKKFAIEINQYVELFYIRKYKYKIIIFTYFYSIKCLMI